MYRNCSKFLAPAALVLTAALLGGCASDNLFAEDDVYVPNTGSKQHPIKLVNGRAKVQNCGVWPSDVGDNSSNQIAANHGCAVQQNIAAMAANPGDVTGKGRPPAPPLGDIQYTALQKLQEPSSTGQ